MNFILFLKRIDFIWKSLLYSFIVPLFLLAFSLQADTIILRDHWEILENSEINLDENLPKNISDLAGWKEYKQGTALEREKTHLLRVKVSAFELKEPTLLVGKSIFSISIYSNNQEIYKFSDKSQFEPAKFLGWIPHIVSLSGNSSESYIYFKVYSGAYIGFPSVSIGNKDEIYKDMILEGLPGVSVVVVSLLLGIVFLLVFLFSRREKLYLAIASFYIFIGIWLFNINLISQFVLPTVPWRLRIEYISLYLAPIGCLYILESIVQSRLNVLSRILRYFFGFYAAISLLLDLLKIFPIWKTLIPFDIFLLLGFIHYIYQVVVYSIRGNKEARIIGVGIILLVSFAVHDIFVVIRIINNLMLMHFGTFSFILSMTGIVVIRVNHLYNEVKKKSHELEENNKILDDLNQNLEHKVTERTKEVTEKMNVIHNLVKQQHGDYFLTSLIQKPLITNRNKSKTVTTEIFIQQKKKFEFNGRESELGGDLCITGNLRFHSDTERYIFFFNGDAMGKSMQGAGGAIVAGTVVNNIIARSARNDKVLKMTPREWIYNTCKEIDEIFCTFDGSMLISGAIGVIQESTGLLWYTNFEHPRTILYRDGKAKFLDSEDTSAYKFGSMIEDNPNTILEYKLEKGDVLLVGSDGRDDIDISKPNDKVRAININYDLILEITEKAKGTISGLMDCLPLYGEQTDDISFIRISILK